MIIVKLKGGLGNQMFQYALALVLAKKNKSELKLDLGFFETQYDPDKVTPRNFELNNFDNKYLVASDYEIRSFFNKNRGRKILNFLINKKKSTVLYDAPHYKAELPKLRADIYLDGYFQSYKYFEHYAEHISKSFVFKELLTAELKQLQKEMQSTASVCIHVRHGDYTTIKAVKKLMHLCTPEYYKDAILRIKKQIRNPKFYVFSDSPSYAVDMFKGHEDMVFVDKKFKLLAATALQLMTSCKHFIIANSSLSWWAAYLAKNKTKTVIAPSKWYKDAAFDINDLIPPEWIKV